MKDQLRALLAAALRDLDVSAATARHIRRRDHDLYLGHECLDLRSLRRVTVLAIGKAARPMMRAVLPALAGLPLRGLCVPPAADDDGSPLPPFEVIGGGHPVPDAGSLRAGARALELLADGDPRDLVLFLISGGGSALCELPLHAHVTLRDLQILHERLVGSGADILAMNAVRKRVSALKGGRLAVRAAPARQHTVLVSDVPRARPDAIASGPTLPDRGLGDEVALALAANDLGASLPPVLRAHLTAAAISPLPAADSPAFARSTWHCVLDQDEATAALANRAREAGMVVTIADTDDRDTARQLGDRLLDELTTLATANPGRTVAVVAGGELSVPLPPRPGIGGRNQQFVLHMAQRIAGSRIAVLSAGTDGRDGSAPAAGAVADGTTIARAVAFGFDAATSERRCAAHPFFAALDDLVVTDAGNNVRDLRLLVRPA